jgi:hypothetical protein
MQALRLPAGRGWQWLVGGFRLFGRSPPLLTFIVFGYFFLLLLINLVPVIGWIAASIAVPALSVSIMNGCRALDRREAVQFGIVISGFQRNLQPLLVLGALYLVASVGAFLLAVAIDGGPLLEMMRSNTPVDAESVHVLRLPLLLMVPVLLAFWFAPLLVAWDDVRPAKALFFSLVAALRNWRAFAIYAFGIALISTVAPAVVLTLAAALSESVVRVLAVALTLPMLFVFVPTLFASFYVSYREVFVPPGEGGDPNDGGDA